MELSKEEVSRLRRLDPAGVHAALIASGAMSIDDPLPKRVGDLRPAENAIDAVMHARKCEYSEAIEWLHETFRDDKTHERNVGTEASSVRDRFASEIVIDTLVKQQIDALGCSEARITLMTQAPDGKKEKTDLDLDDAPDSQADNEKKKSKGGYSLWKGRYKRHGETEEKFFNVKDIMNNTWRLRQENAEGKNILLTPMDNHCIYVLLDDARNRDGSESESPVQSWIAAGYKPCLALQTSWNSHQIIFRVPKEPFRIIGKVGNDDSCFDRHGLHNYFQKINIESGDPKISGLRHGIRLAGYRNMKPKHERVVEGKAWSLEYPFVKIEHAESVFCSKTLNEALRMCRRDTVGHDRLIREDLKNHMAKLGRGEVTHAQKLPPRAGVPPARNMVAPDFSRPQRSELRKMMDRIADGQKDDGEKREHSKCR